NEAWGCRLVVLIETFHPGQCRAKEAGALAECRTPVTHQPAHHRDIDQAFQALERSRDKSAVRPGAGQADIEVIAAGLGREAARATGAGAAVRGDPVATLRLFALETAVAGGVVPLVMPAAIDQKPHLHTPSSGEEEV